MEWIAEYGLWGLGALCFLGATLVPFSSEVAVVGALELGMASWEVFIVASVSNALGASTNYVLGRWSSEWVQRKLEQSRSGRKALSWTQQYGKWGLLGSWLPILGDPLCLAAGVFRVSLLFFIAVGLGTRVARYALLIYLWN